MKAEVLSPWRMGAVRLLEGRWERSRYTVMRTNTSHSWKARRRLQMTVQKYWSSSSYDHVNINNWQRFHL